MYQAMARRYRPETFEGVIGQEHVAQTLRNAITSDRVAHAYLFCGPHGCGKTSMARIFAKSLVCEKGPSPTPCNSCDFCHDIMRGQDTDVHEIDGASNNSVDQVRQLREQAGYVPIRARLKIYIIDEVHMLSGAAFNALLKTLEEPPPHVKFILATTDPHKLPETVLSRCQRFDFRLVPPPMLAEFFKQLAGQEKASIDADALEAVAAFSGGSVRDGLVLLDQLFSYSKGKVSRGDVEQVRGVASAECVAGLYRAMVSHDTAAALALVDEVASHGTNVGDFLDQLIEYGRDILRIVATGKSDGISAYGPARTALDSLAGGLSLDAILLILDVLAQARTRVRQRALTNTLVPLEIAVARLCGLDSLEPVGAMLQKLDSLSRGAPPPTAGRTSGQSPATGHDQAKKNGPPDAAAAPLAEPALPADLSPAPGGPARQDESPAKVDVRDVAAAWPEVLEEVARIREQDLSYLRGVDIRAIEGATLILGVEGNSSFLLEQLDDSRRKECLVAAIAKVLGQTLGVRYDNGHRESAPGPALTAAIPRPASGGRRPDPQRRLCEEAGSDPAVGLLLKHFSGAVSNVEIAEA